MKDLRGKLIARVGRVIVRRTPTGLFRFDYRDATILEIALFPLVYFVIGFVIVGAAYLVSLGHLISWITIVGTPFAACVAILVAGVCCGFAGSAWAIAGYHEFRRRSRHRTDHRLQKRLQQLLAEDSPWVRAHRSIDTECLHANPAPPTDHIKKLSRGSHSR